MASGVFSATNAASPKDQRPPGVCECTSTIAAPAASTSRVELGALDRKSQKTTLLNLAKIPRAWDHGGLLPPALRSIGVKVVIATDDWADVIATDNWR